MPVILTSDEIRGLQAAIASLLSPLDYPSGEAWLGAACSQVLAFLGADQALTMVPQPRGGGFIFSGSAYDLERTARDYLSGIMQFDIGLHVRRRQLGVEVYHRRHVYELVEYHRNPVYGDWAVPHRLLDVIGMGYNPIPGEAVAAMHFYHDHDHEPEDPEAEGAFGARGLALLQLLLPAWKAGVRQYLTFSPSREGVAQLIDHLEEGVALYDVAGHERHRNPSLTCILATDPEGSWLDSLIRVAALRLARAHAAQTRPAPTRSLALSQNVRTAGGCYTLETSQTTLPALGPGLSILVVVRAQKRRPLLDPELRARFQLTTRECEVARLLAAGRSNTEVATALGVTHHTARRHTEAVLRKLAVSSRAAVGAMIRADQPESAPAESRHPASRIFPADGGRSQVPQSQTL